MKTLAGLLILTMSLSAFAELGGRPMTPDVLRSSAKAVRHTSPSSAYSVQEVETGDGVTIREFIAPSGEVFGVVWTGPRMPDLQQLFGAHFRSYRDQVDARRPGRSPVRVNRSDLVVESGGHPRAFRGRAYLPQKLPAGITIGDIK